MKKTKKQKRLVYSDKFKNEIFFNEKGRRITEKEFLSLLKKYGVNKSFWYGLANQFKDFGSQKHKTLNSFFWSKIKEFNSFIQEEKFFFIEHRNLIESFSRGNKIFINNIKYNSSGAINKINRYFQKFIHPVAFSYIKVKTKGKEIYFDFDLDFQKDLNNRKFEDLSGENFLDNFDNRFMFSSK